MQLAVWIKIAWRNILRNKRRTGLTVFAIAASTATLFFFASLNDGFNEQMIDAAVDLHLSHVSIEPRGFHRKMEVEKRFEATPEIRAAARAAPGFRYMDERVKFMSFVSSPRNSTGVLAVGVDPAAARAHSALPEAIREGSFLEDAGERVAPIAIGGELAELLHVGLGDKIVLMNQAADGSLANDLYRVRGIFRSGMPELDRSVVYIPIAEAREFLVYGPDEVSELAIFLDTSARALAARDAIRAAVGDPDLEVLSWQELSKELLQWVEMNDFFTFLMVGMLFFVVAVGVINTLLMAVFERTRELGIMMAIGTQPRQVVGVVLLESLILGLVALAVGDFAGWAVTAYYRIDGIDFSAWSEGLAEFLGSATTVRPVIKERTVALLTGSVFVVSVLAALWPAVRAARLRPVDAIRAL